MDLTLSPAEEQFRDELRGWISDNHPGKEPEGDEASFQFRREWQRKLNERGWGGGAAQHKGGRLGGADLADGVRRRRRDADRAGDPLRGVRARPRAADGQ